MRPLLLVVVYVICLLVVGQTTSVAQTATPQSSGTFWVDRWGQGRFAPHVDFVDQALFPKLIKQVGIPIHLQQLRIKEDVDGEASVIKDFSSLTPLPHSALIRLKWVDSADSPVHRVQKSNKATLQVDVTNNGNHQLTLGDRDLLLFVTVRHPPGQSYNGGHRFYGVRPTQPRGVLRYLLHRVDLFRHDMEFTSYPQLARDKLDPESPVHLKPGESHSWRVTISNWPSNEYELMVQFHKRRSPDISGGSFVFSNPLFLDFLTDDPRRDDLVEMRVRLRENAEIKPGQPIPLEIVFRNKALKELRFPFVKGTKDDLDLSDMLFCYGNDGRVLPLTKKISGSMEIRIPVNESFTLPVDAPEGTVVARAVFYNAEISRPSLGDSNRYVWGWHWSEHWLAPSVKQSLDEPDNK